MRREFSFLAVIAVALLIVIPSVMIFSTNSSSRSDSMYQVGEFNSLLGGNYTARSDVKNLLENGDFGLGTFTGLDGEMIVLDGRCYKATVDGNVSQTEDNATIPFAQVTYFDRDGYLNASGSQNMTELEKVLGSGFASNDTFIFIRIDGTFPEMIVRSVPMQTPPYPPLADVVSEQVVFDYRNVTGTLIGLWSPSYAGTLSYAGFHFHFISDDRTKGGHVLGFESVNASASIDYTDGLEMMLN
jgi:acetolactate decarboxylase